MPRPTTTAPQTRNAERTRARLLKAAIHLFSAKGYHGVPVDAIVAEAKVNKRLVYHYFGSKEQLYLAALEDVFNRLEKYTPLPAKDTGAINNRPADAKLRELFALTFDFLDANPEFIRLLLWENLEQGRHVASAPERLSKNPFMDRFDAVIAEGVRSGAFRTPLDRRHLLVNFIGLCFIYYSNRHSLAVSLQLQDSEAERETRLAQITDLVLNGLLADKPH